MINRQKRKVYKRTIIRLEKSCPWQKQEMLLLLFFLPFGWAQDQKPALVSPLSIKRQDLNIPTNFRPEDVQGSPSNAPSRLAPPRNPNAPDNFHPINPLLVNSEPQRPQFHDEGDFTSPSQDRFAPPPPRFRQGPPRDEAQPPPINLDQLGNPPRFIDTPQRPRNRPQTGGGGGPRNRRPRPNQESRRSRPPPPPLEPDYFDDDQFRRPPPPPRGGDRPRFVEESAKTEVDDEEEKPTRLQILLANSRFECGNKKDGYYADTEVNCEVFHYCAAGVKNSWICPEGASFHQVHLICMPPGRSDDICKQSEQFHFVNDYLYQPLNENEATKYNESLIYADRYYPEGFVPGSSQDLAGLRERERQRYRDPEPPREPERRRPVPQVFGPPPPQRGQAGPPRRSPPPRFDDQDYIDELFAAPPRRQGVPGDGQSQPPASFRPEQINIPLERRRPGRRLQ